MVSFKETRLFDYFYFKEKLILRINPFQEKKNKTKQKKERKHTHAYTKVDSKYFVYNCNKIFILLINC